MQWRFFVGACLLTGALLQPHAPVKSVLGGIGVAALIQLALTRIQRRRERRALGTPDSSRIRDHNRPDVDL
jgi:hypothetical protein